MSLPAIKPLPADRKRVFLDGLRRGRSVSESLRIANPHCRGAQPGYSTLRHWREQDPAFDQAWIDAEMAGLDHLRDMMLDRATGDLEPVIQNGEHVKDARGNLQYRRRYDSKVLLRLANKLPELNERREVTHRSENGHSITLVSSDRKYLTAEQWQQLCNLLSIVRDGYNKARGLAGATIPGAPLLPPVEDAEFVEVDDDDSEEEIQW